MRKMMQLTGTDDVNFIGTGEVLNVETEPKPGIVNISMDNDDQLITEENYKKLPDTYTIRKFGHANDKELLLTFDDGPDERWTPTVLKTLKKYNVPAAFFMVGLQMEKNLPLVKKVYDEGYPSATTPSPTTT